NRRHIVADEKYRAPAAGDVTHLSETFLLEACITYSKNFVDNQYFWFEMSRHGKREPNHHPRRVVLRRCIQKHFDARKLDDLVELAVDLPLRHSENRAVHIDVVAAGQFRMESRANLQKARDATSNHSAAERWFRNP